MKKAIVFTAVALLVASVALAGTIKPNGINQKDLYNFLSDTTSIVSELQTDHATQKTATDQTETVVEEMVDDHATLVTGVTALQTRLNQMRFNALYNTFGNPGFVIDTNFDVKNGTAAYYANGGTLKTLAANGNFDTGTAATLTTARWGAGLLTVNASGTGVVTWFVGAGSPGAGYASEAEAIAAMTIGAATETPMGYFTVLAGGATWTAGTCALQGGTGGTVATTTNYYNSINPNSLYIGSAVTGAAPATLTAPKPASGPATLTNSTPLSLTQ